MKITLARLKSLGCPQSMMDHIMEKIEFEVELSSSALDYPSNINWREVLREIDEQMEKNVEPPRSF